MSIEKKLDAFVEKVISETLEDIVSERFGRYSKYIIQDRALPDARDGLKPVQRRILYAMHQMGMFSNKPYKKSARIAGEVMGKYHPHGDSSIYEAMVRMSQDFKMRIPLVDMHGNNGSIDGDNAAAMRYTEARLSKGAEYLILDIDKRTVPFIPNFDDEEIEPTVLPAKYPNLLINGATGISAGYATKIPPHNLTEVVSATIAYLDNEAITLSEITQIIKGPDFPTGGIVQGLDGIVSALGTGAGKVMIRAKTQIEEVSKTQDRITITEIPYEVNKADLVRQMDMLRIDKKIDDILEVRDESDQEGLRIAIDLRKGADAQFILNILYKFSDLQVSYNYNMVAILNHRPVLVGVLPILSAYVNHQKEVITNRSNYDLAKATKRLHIVEGLIKMVSVVDQIVAIIRKSENKTDAKENIMAAFGFSELQAEAIVTLQLYRLSNTDIEENVMIGFTRDGYLKRSNLKSFQLSTQAGLKSEDTLIYLEELTTLHHIIIFTNLGNFAFIPVYKIDDQKWKDLGIYINNIVPFEEGEMAIKLFAFKTFDSQKTFVLVTTQGQMKQVTLDQFEMVRYQKTTRCMVLDDGDILADVSLAMQPYISIISKNGIMLNISRDEVPYYGLSARGVKAIKLSNHDYVTAVTTFNIEDDLHLISSRGHLITLNASDLPLSKRLRKGFTAIEEVKSQPHIIHYMKATPKNIQDDVIIQSFSDTSQVKELLKNVVTKENKFGKPLFKGKKEIHLQSYIHYEEFDSYQQVVKKPKVVDVENQVESQVEEEVLMVDQKPIEVSLIDSKKERQSITKTFVEDKKEPTKETTKDEDIPKKTESIQRLSLFDDDDL
jgi:DNA gyrase/topoisomerase IV subunit A